MRQLALRWVTKLAAGRNWGDRRVPSATSVETFRTSRTVSTPSAEDLCPACGFALGRLVKRLRRAWSLSRRDISLRTGIAEKTLTLIESCHCAQDIDQLKLSKPLCAYADVFGYDIKAELRQSRQKHRLKREDPKP